MEPVWRIRTSPAAVNLGVDDQNDPVTATAVATGDNYACAITSIGLKCWGFGNNGRLGDGDSGNHNVPVAVNVGSDVSAVQLSLGVSHTCAVLSDRNLKCWGNNLFGRLGIGSTAQQLNPVAVDLGGDVRQVANGYEHSCGLLEDNTVKCWGRHHYGSLGAGSGHFARGDYPGEMGEKLPRVSLNGGKYLGDIIWGAFAASSLVVGDAPATPAAPTGMVEGASVRYSQTDATSANCTLYDANTGKVRANAVDMSTSPVCALTVTVSKRGFQTQTHEISIPLEAAPSKGIAWNVGTTGLQLGDSPVTLGAVTGASSGITYAVTSAGSTNCAFTTGSELSFDTAGTCRVQATVRRSGYSDWTSPEFNIEVTALDPVDITWGGYSDTNVLNVGDSLAALTRTLAPSSATESFALVSVPNGACTINNGALTAVSVGTCYVTLSATDSGGSRAVGKRVVAVRVLEAFDFTTAGIPAYGDTTLGIGTDMDMANLPEEDDHSIYVDWSFAAAGIRYGSAQDGICSVDSDSFSDTFGRVTASTDARLGDVCTITVTGVANGFQTYRDEIELSLRHPHPLQVVSGIDGNTCVLFEGGRVKCWGINDEGQLGIGDNSGSKIYIGDADGEMGENLPYLDFGVGRRAVQISAGDYHACAVLDNGKLKCWGYNFNGQLGYGNNSDLLAPGGNVNLGGGALQVAGGGAHTCAVLVGGDLKCWGNNYHGVLGDGTSGTGNRTTPLRVNLGDGVKAAAVTAGDDHVCALLTSGSVMCWGGNDFGQVGDGTSGTNRTSPVAVNLGVDEHNNPVTATAVVAGNNHTCAITSVGLACWGSGGSGQLGDGNTGNHYAPVAVNVGSEISAVQLSLGFNSTCAVLSDSSLKCWGSNNSGQLGIGSTTNQSSPVAVDLGGNVRRVRISYLHSCGVLEDNTVKCWGSHEEGSLGAGSGTFTWGDDAGEMGDNLQAVPLHGQYLGEITWGAFADSALVMGGSHATPEAPTLTEADVTIGYAVTDETSANCTLEDPVTGEVSAHVVDIATSPQCTLIVTVSKSGFETQQNEISIPLAGADLGTITWGDFSGGATLVVGGETVTPDETTHASADIAYAVTDGTAANCELVDAATGEVAAKAVDVTGSTLCTLEITASALGYTTQTHQISINLEAGTQSGIAWGPGVLGFQTSAATATLDGVTGADAAASVTYAVNSAGTTSCSFGTSTSSVLDFTAAGTCTVQATATRTGYNDWTSPPFDVVISDSAPVQVAWFGYSAGVVAVGGTLTTTAPTPTPGDAVVTFSAVGVPDGACTIATDGTITGVAVGVCYVTVSATHASHGDYKRVVAIRVANELDFTLAGVPGYGDDTTLGLGAWLDMANLPAADDAGASVTWSFSVAGTRSGATQSGVCSVDETSGRVSAGASAQVDDVCTVTITGTATGLDPYTAEIELTLRQPRALQVVGHFNSYCALIEGGRVKCWGNNGRGQLGAFATIDSNTQRIGDSAGEMGSSLPFLNFGTGRTAVQVSVGKLHACAVLDNADLMCWGEGDNGRLGYGNTSDLSTPSGVVASNVQQVSVGELHTCAVLNTGEVKCWGEAGDGRLGDGQSATDRNSPVSVNLGTNIIATEVAAGGFHTCALVRDRTVQDGPITIKCWGRGSSGQLGRNTNGNSNRPVAVSLGAGVTASQVAVGDQHTCAITSGGLKCWGDGLNGRLGDGNTGNHSSPVSVSGSLSAVQLSLGYQHTCAVLSDGA